MVALFVLNHHELTLVYACAAVDLYSPFDQ
jgi:hypothetical protein